MLEQADFFDSKEWKEKRKDGSTVELKQVFHEGFFNYLLPYKRNPNGSVQIIHKYGEKMTVSTQRVPVLETNYP